MWNYQYQGRYYICSVLYNYYKLFHSKQSTNKLWYIIFITFQWFSNLLFTIDIYRSLKIISTKSTNPSCYISTLLESLQTLRIWLLTCSDLSQCSRAYSWENQVFVVFTTNESIRPQMLVFTSLIGVVFYGAWLIDRTS